MSQAAYPPAGPGYAYRPGHGYPPGPPPDMFARYTGYENTRFGSSYVPPPPPYVPQPASQIPEQHFSQSNIITEEQAREAMLQFVSEHCCYGKLPAQEMTIKDINPSNSYHYSLESFCESRATEWKFEPYRGQPIDSPVNGVAPQPWDINVQPPEMFADRKTKLEVPHTANIKPCHDCKAVGYIQCDVCCGDGSNPCGRCNGSGNVQEMDETVQCSICFGTGYKRCDECNGDGRVKCPTCEGNAQMKTFIELTVTWKNHKSDEVVGQAIQLPGELVVDSKGTELFSQELPRVWPITNFFEQQINISSKKLVEEHARKWPSKRILLQRQILRAVPVSEVFYEWKETSSRYWVFGLDHQVYAPDYPQKCCCGCSIL